MKKTKPIRITIKDEYQTSYEFQLPHNVEAEDIAEVIANKYRVSLPHETVGDPVNENQMNFAFA